jgi:hypothetical protein
VQIVTGIGRLAVAPNHPGALAMLRWPIGPARDWSGDVAPFLFRVRWLPVSWEVIAVAVRWYLRYGPSYRDVEHRVPLGPTVHA